MAVKIIILALAAVIWKAECQLSREAIYKNPLRPPYAAESPIFASASSESNISPIPGANIPNSFSVPFSQSSQVPLSSTSTPESALESLSTSSFDANELVDKSFSEFSQQTKFGNLQLSKPRSAKVNSKALNYSPNPPSRPISPGCNIHFEGPKIVNPKLEQFERPFSSMGESSTVYTNPVSNYDVTKTIFEPKETSGESLIPLSKRTFPNTGSNMLSPGSDIDLKYKESPKTFSSATAFSKFQQTSGTKNVFNGPWNTPISEEVPPLINYELESLPLSPCQTLRGTQLSSLSLYDTSKLDEATKPFVPESSILPKRLSASRKPIKVSKNSPIQEINKKPFSSISESPTIKLKTTEIDNTNNCEKSGIFSNNLKTLRNWSKTHTGNIDNIDTDSLKTSISSIDTENSSGFTSNMYTDINNYPNSKTINIPQAPIAGPLKENTAKSYDINEIKKLNPVPSFIGITEIFNVGHSSLIENFKPNFPSVLNLVESSASLSAPPKSNIPFPSSEPIYDTPQSIAQASAFAEATNTINVDPTNVLTPFSYQQKSSRFLPFDFPQTSPFSAKSYSSDYTFYPEEINPVSTYSTVPAPNKPPAYFSETSADFSDPISLGIGRSGFKTFSGATSASSAQIFPSFSHKTIKPVSSAPSMRTSLSKAEASSSANPFIGQSGATANQKISSLGSKLDNTNSYLKKSYSSVKTKTPSTLFSSLSPTTFSPFSQTSMGVAETNSPVGPIISGSTSSAQAISNSYISESSPIKPSVSLNSPPSKKNAPNVQSTVNMAETSTSSLSSVSSTSLVTSDTTNPVFTPYIASQTMNAIPTAVETLEPAIISPVTTLTDSATSSTAAIENLGSLSTSSSASATMLNSEFSSYTASQTMNTSPTATEILAPAGILPITTITDSTTSAIAAARNIGPLSISYSASEASTNSVFSPYTASQTTNVAPIASEILAPTVSSPTITGIDSTTSSITATENLDSLLNSYSASEAASELLMPAEMPMPVVYSPSAKYVSPTMSSIDIPINIPEAIYPISAFNAADSKCAVPMKTESLPMSYAPVTQNTTPTMSSMAISTNPTSYASSYIINVTPLVTDTTIPLSYPGYVDSISSITSSAISKSTNLISSSIASTENNFSNPILPEILPTIAEIIEPLPVVDTITSSVSSATELVDPISSISTSSSITTTNSVESPIDNTFSTVSQTSTSSAFSQAAPEVTTPFSRPTLQSQYLYNLEVCPVTIEVQIPSSLGTCYTSANSGYAPSRANTIPTPYMYEVQIPSSMAAQLSCSLGSKQTNMPILCMNVENVPSGKCYR